VALLGTPAVARAQQRPIRLIVPYIPGSAPDVVARQLSDRLSAALGQTVVIESRPGAGGNIGNEAAARAPADGSVLLLVTNALLVLPQLHRRPVGYDPLKDFVPVTVATAMPHLLIVPNDGPATTAALIDLLKRRPGQVNYASGGNGSGAHLAAELFKARAAVEAVHVPFRGAPDIVNAVMGGQVQFGFPTLATVTELVRSLRLRGLGVTSAGRNHALPEVPAIAETLPGFDLVSWFGLMAPAGSPPDFVRRVDEATRAALAEPELRQRIMADGSIVVGMEAAAFAEFLPAEYRKWGDAVRLGGAQVD
jgi:tripartite-type tricarboxylate transporter receptor subunit TctC